MLDGLDDLAVGGGGGGGADTDAAAAAAAAARDATVVLVTSDHGYHLGEQAMWGKCSNYELAVRAPFVLRVPWWGAPRGRGFGGPAALAPAFAELVDVYRTLADVARLTPPPPDVQGKSLAPAGRAAAGRAAASAATAGAGGAVADSNDGDGEEGAPANDMLAWFALSQYPRCPRDWRAPWRDNSCKHTATFPVMGYTLRTPGWRLTEWYNWSDGAPMRGRFEIIGEELYAYDDAALAAPDGGAGALDSSDTYNWLAQSPPRLDVAPGGAVEAALEAEAEAAACVGAALRPALRLLILQPSAGCDGGTVDAETGGCAPGSAEFAQLLAEARACAGVRAAARAAAAGEATRLLAGEAEAASDGRRLARLAWWANASRPPPWLAEFDIEEIPHPTCRSSLTVLAFVPLAALVLALLFGAGVCGVAVCRRRRRRRQDLVAVASVALPEIEFTQLGVLPLDMSTAQLT